MTPAEQAATTTAPRVPPGDTALLVRGVSPVLEVPFTDAGEVDYTGFERVVRYVLSTGVTSVMFPGFASEFHKLSDAERARLVDILLQHTRDRADVAAVLAVQDHATRLAVAHARRLVEAGTDLINLLPPYFLTPTPEAVRTHVRAVLEAVAPTPVVLQYAPHQTGTSLDAATISGLAREHSNLALVKVESTPPGAFIAALGAQDPALPAVVGYAGVQLPDALRRGAVGLQPGCSVTEIYVEIWRLFERGDRVEALDLHRRLLPYISYWMLDTELIIAAEKLVSVRRGLFESAHCRAPAHRLDAEEIAMIDRLLEEFADLLPPLGN
ncbi:4-hydroxy-tetrahydrodipicolinate synthase [Actinopolymorpha cephalotaxi]|uniref:4-hydroxy-tetrahydrodipicolinate synthase n=1 Tax=Actinopolymorpha cephalotaxi TaxID=504797 RepID=A0A1I2S5B3_9ACTN|nr:dihydrodipicolinate synthase family protein [Actinopolymorpha cephalotaxi]NYH83825.1 4-hydroxy-tetrahydrodipicolinate synthase [Actinopolymorpha cephalotaxi]SFG45191.1 4-hydroxy-tetrahydrodipicolinate synthase [Actinopolymorpha cephalotaxi]